MIITKTFKPGQKIQYELPYADREWTARIADTIDDLNVAGGESGNTGNMLTDVERLGSKVKRLADGCFQDCVRLRSVSVPATVKEIGDGCFAGCESLSDIQIAGKGLTAVGVKAFDGCGARRLTLPATLSSASMINAAALAGSNLTNLVLLGIDSTQLSTGIDPGPEPDPPPEPGPYKTLNPQIYGIDDWDYFRERLFADGNGEVAPEEATAADSIIPQRRPGDPSPYDDKSRNTDRANPVSSKKAFEQYLSAKRTIVEEGEPQYGITYLQDVETDPGMSTARKIIQTAKSDGTPLIMFFGEKPGAPGYPSDECLPFYGLLFTNIPEGAANTAAARFEQFMAGEFPDLTVYGPDRTRTATVAGYCSGKTFNAYEHRSETPPACTYNGFAKHRSWETADVLNQVANAYTRRQELEQSLAQLKFLTEYEALAESRLSGVDLSESLDGVYNAPSDSGGGTMHIRPESNPQDTYKYGVWYGTGRNGQEWAQPPDDQIRALHRQCDEHHIPLIILQTNLYGGCGDCNALFSSWIDPPQFRNWLVKSPYMFFVDGTWNKDNAVAKYIKENIGLDLSDTVSAGIYWKKPDGSVIRACRSDNYYTGRGVAWLYPAYMTDAVRRAAFEDQMHYAVDWALKDYVREPEFENDVCLPYLQAYTAF